MIQPKGAKTYQGLSESAAKERLEELGYNELPPSNASSPLQIIFGIVREPMFILLLSCGGLYFFLGDKGEGLMLMSSVFVVVYISYFQQRKTERALEALRELSTPRALVIREGLQKRIAGREVVKDDLLVLQEGDRICADAVVLKSINLRVDESILTGESLPVRKSEKIESTASSPENSDLVYSGTLVVQGNGIARVTTTGVNTKFGKIGSLLKEVKESPTLLQQETARIIKLFSIAGLSLCIIVTVVYGVVHSDWLRGILVGLSLSIAMLPEEFAIILTIFTALGAWRLSKKNVLTRKPAAIETLSAVTVLCADKTGTLTQNKMSIERLFSNGHFFDPNLKDHDLPEEFHSLIEYAILASQRNPFDPMERAILNFGDLKLSETEHIHKDWRMEKEYPLSNELLAISHVFRHPTEDAFVIATKGSPEAIADLCHFSPSQKKYLDEQVSSMASNSLRVLGVARAMFSSTHLPENQHDFDFELIGLIGLQDPLRETIGKDLAECFAAGIRVIMITGDYPATAQHIAKSMGLKNPDECITGSMLQSMSEKALSEKIKTVNIFARVNPEQKLSIVNTLKENGEIVAMTGDGVNDAPSLKAAHVGIAMGQRGTDVAREASSLVLLDDNFSSITNGIRMGRRIYDNIQKAMVYVFAVHIPIAGLAFFPVFFPALPLILLPLHIAFLELIIDPTCSLIFEAEKEEEAIMNRAPRKASEPVLSTRKILVGSLQGVIITLVCISVYFIAHELKRPENEIRALAFTTLIVANVGLILINRSWTSNFWQIRGKPNPALKWVLVGITTFLFIALYMPGISRLFHFDVLHAGDLLICLSAGVISVAWFELLKALYQKKNIFRFP